MNRPLIRIILEGFNRSGGVRVVCDVANGLARNQMQVEIVVPHYAATPAFPLHANVRVVAIRPTSTARSPKLDYFQWLCQRSAATGDLIVATSYRTPWVIVASRAWMKRRVPVLYMVQHDEVLSQVQHSSAPAWMKAILRPIAAGSYRLKTHHVAVSQWIADRVAQPGARVIPNGVDPTVFFAGPDRTREDNAPFVVGGIARPSGAKGWQELVQAMLGLREQHGQGVRFHLASPSDTLPALPCSLIDTVFLRPRNDADMRAFYLDLDAFLFTSPVEGYGLPPLEAMACGIPVVITECGGISEYANSDNATLVPVGDIAAMVRGVSAFVSDPKLCADRTTSGLRTAAEFTLEKQTDAWVEVVQSLLMAGHR
jgi:glycosyltransferase involved in cell wall biosynthesis